MDLAPGTRLGPYEIIAPLGAGGMGEVYRARDTRLDRCVAIKILPAHFSGSPELKTRFEREARTLSSVTHPHICHLYDVGSQSGIEFLVMELLEGETLCTRLRKGPLPLNDLLRIGIEITDALAKAHRLGLVHRDLKPANIMLTKAGAKLMDFGLAKFATQDSPAAATPPPSDGETATTLQTSAPPMTSVGAVVGTIPYISPEQIEGKEADSRSDIFSLGAVLYEMATGQRAFEGKSRLSVASAILEKEPPPVTSIKPAAPPTLCNVISTCLAKDPEERFQTAHDVKLQLGWLVQSGASFSPMQAKQREHRFWHAATFVAAAVALVLAFVLLKGIDRPAAGGPAITRFTIPLPPKQELAVEYTEALALSPDGKRLAYVGAESGIARLYVRRFDQFDAVAIPDSEGAGFPFFSPNGEWIAFFSQGKIKKAPAEGGTPVPVCSIPTIFGATWTPKDLIVVAVPSIGLETVPASGGQLTSVHIVSKKQVYFQGPLSLPGGEWILFTDYLEQVRTIKAANLGTGELRTLITNAQSPWYSESTLIYYSGGALWAVPFNVHKIAVAGNPERLASDVAQANYLAQESASFNGLLAYAPGTGEISSRSLYFVNRKGVEQKIDTAPQDFVDPSMSPDGSRFAIAIRSATAGQEIAVYDRKRGGLSLIVSDGEINASPVWTPDGKNLFFDSFGASKKRGIYRVAADGSASQQLVHETSASNHVTSTAGRYAAVMVNDPITSYDLWLLDLTNKNEMRPFKRTPAAERQGSLSPDGRWIAYASNETGRSEIYVEPVPGPGGRWQISFEGGEQPRWVRNGREILFRNGTKMMSVPVQIRPTFQAAKPLQIFDRKFDRGAAIAGYDVSPDGQTFIMMRSVRENPTEIRVVLGWPGARQTTR